MNETNRLLDETLKLVSEGSQESKNNLIALLKEVTIYLPVTSLLSLGSEEKLRKEDLLRIVNAGVFVPIFTEEEYFFSWLAESGSNYRCAVLQGKELSDYLGHKEGLIINLGQQSKVILKSKEVAQMNNSNHEVEVVNKVIPISEAVKKAANIEELAFDLKRLFTKFPEIEEAYSTEIETGNIQYRLGISRKDISFQKRFSLVAEIAKISKEYFNQAGAIELYDDLSRESSKSWEIFENSSQFYERELV